MTQYFRKLTGQVLIYGSGDLVVRALQFAQVALLTRLLTPDGFGLFSLALTSAGFLTLFVSFGSDTTYTRFFVDSAGDDLRARLTSTWISGLGILSLIGAGAGVALSAPMAAWITGDSKHGAVLAAVMIAVPITIISATCNQALRSQFDAFRYSVINVCGALVLFGLIVVAVPVMGLGPFGAALATSFGVLVMLPVRLASIRNLLTVNLDRKLFADMLRYGRGLAIAGFFIGSLTIVDRLLLARFAGLSSVGVYSVAATIAGIMSLAVGAFSQAWQPRFLELWRRDPDTTPLLVARMIPVMILGFGSLAVGLAWLVRPLVHLLAGPAYAGAHLAAGPLLVGGIAAATAPITAAGLILQKRSDLQLRVAVVAATISLLINIVLIPILGIVGAATANAVGFICLAVGYGILSQRIWPLPLEGAKVVLVATLVSAGILMPSLFPALPLIVDIALAVLFAAVVAALGSALLGLTARRIYQELTAPPQGGPDRVESN